MLLRTHCSRKGFFASASRRSVRNLHCIISSLLFLCARKDQQPPPNHRVRTFGTTSIGALAQTLRAEGIFRLGQQTVRTKMLLANKSVGHSLCLRPPVSNALGDLRGHEGHYFGTSLRVSTRVRPRKLRGRPCVRSLGGIKLVRASIFFTTKVRRTSVPARFFTRTPNSQCSIFYCWQHS